MAALAHSIRRSAIGLGLFAVITGGTIAMTQALTKDRIQTQAARAEAKALFEIIPESAHDNNLLRDTVQLPASDRLSTEGPLTVWVARRDDRPIGLIMPITAPDGYSGDIHLLVAVDLQGTVIGVRVTSHKETPGLGDRIERRKSDWITSFDGRSLEQPSASGWDVKKNGGEFDQFTGATITPRAVVNAVEKALVYFEQHRPAIRERLNAPPVPGQKAITPDALAGHSSSPEHS